MSVGKVVNKIIKNLPKIGPRNITYLHIKKIVRQIVSCTYIKLLQYLEVRLGCDPTSIGGEDGSGNQQNDGLDAGFNKHWWNWNTIRAMNSICRKYWYYEQ